MARRVLRGVRYPALNLATLVETLLEWQDRARQRQKLLELDDAMLKDIGVTRSDALSEASKPFWTP